MFKDHQDTFGHGMYDYLNGSEGFEIAERDANPHPTLQCRLQGIVKAL